MTYASQSDLEKYFGQAYVLLAADRDADGSYDTNVISTALTAADEEIDSYLAVRYDLPLAATPGVITRVACDLAMYHMSIDTPAMTEDKEKRYNNGIKWLEKLSKGIVTLGAEEEEVVVQDDFTLSSDSPERVFTRTRFSGLM